MAAEMPAVFPEEALKAQAVAARTYQVRHMQATGNDAVLHDVGQAYCTVAEQKEKWGENYGFYAGKIRDAVRETSGEIMVYEGEPILAAFHAQSGGRTEDAENVWKEALPYLRSVESADDRNAPDNQTTAVFSAKEVKDRLGSDEMEILSRTEAGYVDEVQVGERIFSGREIREALGLRSTNFSMEKNGNDFIFTVFGYGHGAGMSQYGASFLAEKGMGYLEILQHYYTDIDFQQIE